MSKLRDTIGELIEDMEIKKSSGNGAGKYDERIDALVNDLYGSATEGFKYNPDEDPSYRAAVKDYGREADRTMRDVLGQGAARTGGIASTAAISAASQARDYRMSELEDAKAKLYDNALARNQAEVNAKYQILSALENLDSDERNNYLNLLSMEESLADKEKSEAQNQIQNMLAMGLTPGDDLIAASGWGNDYVRALERSALEGMSTEQVQQYLNAKGAGLDVDGSWGPKTEAAYREIFGMPSGRQKSYGSGSGSGSGYMPNVSGGIQSIRDTIGAAKSAFGKLFGSPDNSPTGSSFNGSTYEEAYSYISKNGSDEAALGLMTKDEWRRRRASYRASGQGSVEVANYDSYEDYLQDYVAFATGK